MKKNKYRLKRFEDTQKYYNRQSDMYKSLIKLGNNCKKCTFDLKKFNIQLKELKWN